METGVNQVGISEKREANLSEYCLKNIYSTSILNFKLDLNFTVTSSTFVKHKLSSIYIPKIKKKYYKTHLDLR